MINARQRGQGFYKAAQTRDGDPSGMKVAKLPRKIAFTKCASISLYVRYRTERLMVGKDNAAEKAMRSRGMQPRILMQQQMI